LFDITQGLGHINVFSIIVPFKAFVPLLNEIVHVAVKSGVVPVASDTLHVEYLPVLKVQIIGCCGSKV
jgi:hypothetical protein